MKLAWQKMVMALVAGLLCNSEEIYSSPDSTENYSKPGIFVGLAVPYNTVGADFDGKSTLVDRGAIFRLPEVEGSFGFEILLGYGGKLNSTLRYVFELSFTKSVHNVRWLETESNADYFSFCIDGRLHFLADQRIQPYVMIGFSFPDIFIVRDDTVITTTPQGSFNTARSDVRFKSTIGRVGGGIAYCLNRKVSIIGGVAYRIRKYAASASIVRAGPALESSVKKASGSGLTFDIGLRFTF
jgi:hypothetical protein